MIQRAGATGHTPGGLGDEPVHPDAIRSAWYWEFLSTEGGTSYHKVDVFVHDPSGNGFAILTQAPADEWTATKRLLHAIRGTLTSTSNRHKAERGDRGLQRD